MKQYFSWAAVVVVMAGALAVISDWGTASVEHALALLLLAYGL
ncbi:hypothetical protein [Streptomyces sp. NBC_00233]|nr:hypothetical protein [Streptomyces sp. NBC_00233]MCX5233391.1 hypothetical protein [Streptomyces sp. NBC_00233]